MPNTFFDRLLDKAAEYERQKAILKLEIDNFASLLRKTEQSLFAFIIKENK